MGEDLLDPAQVQVVANIPPREVLLSHLVTALESPISSFANSLQSIISELAYVLDSVEEEKKKSAWYAGKLLKIKKIIKQFLRR